MAAAELSPSTHSASRSLYTGSGKLSARSTEALIVATAFGLLLCAELRRPLRRAVEGKRRRNVRNFAVAALSAAAIQVAEKPFTNYATGLVERRRWGLLPRLPLPDGCYHALALLLLDYSLYVWHVLTHRIPWLWRLHQVHHVDLDMDASTAIRFHFAEMLVSIPWRVAQILVIGASRRALALWQTALLVEIMFHHSNVELPQQCERWLGKFIVTPRMHGVHHSRRTEEVNSNWSSGLTLWDWLHGTLRHERRGRQPKIGVAGYDLPAQVTLLQILALPFLPARRRRYSNRNQA